MFGANENQRIAIFYRPCLESRSSIVGEPRMTYVRSQQQRSGLILGQRNEALRCFATVKRERASGNISLGILYLRQTLEALGIKDYSHTSNLMKIGIKIKHTFFNSYICNGFEKRSIHFRGSLLTLTAAPSNDIL